MLDGEEEVEAEKKMFLFQWNGKPKCHNPRPIQSASNKRRQKYALIYGLFDESFYFFNKQIYGRYFFFTSLEPNNAKHIFFYNYDSKNFWYFVFFMIDKEIQTRTTLTTHHHCHCHQLAFLSEWVEKEQNWIRTWFELSV